MTIGKKISLACVALVALTTVLGLISIVKITQMNQGLESITKESLPSLGHIVAMVESAKETKFTMMSHIASDNPANMSKAESAIAEQESKFQAAVKGYQSVDTSARGRELLEQVLSTNDQMERVWQRILPYSRASKNAEAYGMWMAEAQAPAGARAKALDELIAYSNGSAAGLGTAAADTGESARLWAMLVLTLSVVSGGLLAFFIVRGINKALTQAVTELSEGAEQVSSAAGQVSGSSQSLAQGAAGQVSGSSQSLAQGASQQAASLEETSASSEQMSSMTRKNAENSQQAAEFMHAVSQRVADANRTLADMTTSMQEISDSSGKISKIIKVIDEIAFQTNILALNAAVEAARAGEAGMGFAVVADEVRNLAQRSAQAAKDTATLIEDSILKSGEGSRKLGEVASSIQAITEGAGKVKTLVDEVEASSKEQAQGIEQISKAVAQMDQVTQKTAANAEESASASQQLSAQSQALMAVVVQLEALVGSGSPAVSRRPEAGNRSPAVRSVHITRGLPPAKPASRKPVPALASAGRHHTGQFPLDESEFKEFCAPATRGFIDKSRLPPISHSRPEKKEHYAIHSHRTGSDLPGAQNRRTRRQIPDFRHRQGGVRCRRPEGPGNHGDSGHHRRAADARLPERRDQPARQGDAGHRSALEIRAAQPRLHAAHLHHRGAGQERFRPAADRNRGGRSFRSYHHGTRRYRRHAGFWCERRDQIYPGDGQDQGQGKNSPGYRRGSHQPGDPRPGSRHSVREKRYDKHDDRQENFARLRGVGRADDPARHGGGGEDQPH